MRKLVVLVGLAVVVAGCGSHRPPPQGPRQAPFHPPIEILIHYVDQDGNITRASMEAGLRRDFERDDLNHDGVLEQNEVLAVNERRWKRDASAYSPLVDWNGDGVVDFREFAAAARSLFDELDTSGKGIITAKQLKALTGGAPERQPQGEGGYRRTHERRGGPGGEPGEGGGDTDGQ